MQLMHAGFGYHDALELRWPDALVFVRQSIHAERLRLADTAVAMRAAQAEQASFTEWHKRMTR